MTVENYETVSIEPLPVGLEGVDEIAARLGVAPDAGGPGIVTVQGRSGLMYPLHLLVHALLDRLDGAA